jgi:hypothetical protein
MYNIQYLYIVDCDVAEQCMQNISLHFLCNSGYTNLPSCYIMHTPHMLLPLQGIMVESDAIYVLFFKIFP